MRFLRRTLMPLSLGALTLCGLVLIWRVQHAGTWTPARHLANAREGFAARASFEIVPPSRLPTPGAGSHVLTFPLDPDDAAYEVDSPGLGYPDRVSLAWDGPSTTVPFRVDLFLHARQGSTAPVVLVRDLDIRKFFHQPPSLDPALEDLDRLQAYFEEFSRKAKLVYPKRDASRSYEESALRRVHRLVERAMALGLEDTDARLDVSLIPSGVVGPLEPSELQVAMERLVAARRTIRRSASPSSRSTPRLDEMLSAAASELLHISAARTVSTLKITNNCREPGNFEVALADAVGHTIFKGSFNITPDVYDHLLRRYHGLGIQDQGTGLRVSATLRDRSLGRYWYSLLPWTRLHTFPRVEVEVLESITPAANAETTASRREGGRIEVVRGRIPYENASLETRRKIAFRHSQGEPLAYVRVDPKLPMPAGFRLPHDRSPNEFWIEPANAGKIVPHRYAAFEDLHTYDVYLSGFETNGVYVGRAKRYGPAWHARLERDSARHDLPVSTSEHIDWDRTEGRWNFDYDYLEDLDRFELETTGDLVTIRLLSRPGSPRGVNFVFGRIHVGVGMTATHLFGIGTQPLIADYDTDVFQDVPVYAFAFDNDGTILDHHRLDIGVEQVQVRRPSEDVFVVTLISHERIMPVWSGVLRTSIAQARAS